MCKDVINTEHGSFNSDYVRSFSTKEKFIKANKNILEHLTDEEKAELLAAVYDVVCPAKQPKEKKEK